MTNQNLKKTCGIYRITHTESGMIYVGQSIDIFSRWKSHTSGQSRTSICSAIQSEGVSQFVLDILEECSKEDLNSREKWWITELDCFYPRGYNRTCGGDYTTVFSEESKQMMSNARKKKWTDEAYRQKMTELHKGKTLSEETRQKISSAQKGRPQSDDHKKKRGDALRALYKMRSEIKQLLILTS